MSVEEPQERWSPVVGWEDRYLVSDRGNVLSTPKRTHKAPLSLAQQRSTRGGYPTVGLHRNGGRRIVFVHVLMLEAFIGPRPPGSLALHADDNPENLALDNLRWGTRSDNLHDAVKNGRHAMARKTHCKRGHEFTPENTWVSPSSGGRTCRECRRVGGY